MLSDILVFGLLNGAVYAMLAIGFSLIFGAARIFNLAHTAYFMLGAYAVFYFGATLNFSPFLAIPLSVAVVVLIGIVIYYIFMEPLRGHEAAMRIVTVALALVIQESVLIVFGGHFHGVPSIVSGHVSPMGIRISYQYLLTLGVVSFALVGVWYLLMKTRLGLSIRSMAQDREVANLMGMNIGRIAAATMAISVGLAAVAGVMVAPLYILEPSMWLGPLVLIMATVILGGLGSIKGSFFGALIIAFVEVIVIFTMPGGAFLRVAIALAIMLIILIVRPEGLFGVYMEGER
ncbi:MAG TPA: branched-chain amino acid ABC transporter permease [Candidatus Limnocylindrales bacterium]|nr:branched-chain amino acid ABC transporter permease [Candidatus Limnocylindrales bacterium]